jgi:hypothetical protein
MQLRAGMVAASLRRSGPADARTNRLSTFTEASYTKYLTLPMAVSGQRNE